MLNEVMDQAAVHKLVRYTPRYDHEENAYSAIDSLSIVLKTFVWLEKFAYLCNWIIFQVLEYLS